MENCYQGGYNQTGHGSQQRHTNHWCGEGPPLCPISLEQARQTHTTYVQPHGIRKAVTPNLTSLAITSRCPKPLLLAAPPMAHNAKLLCILASIDVHMICVGGITSRD